MTNTLVKEAVVARSLKESLGSEAAMAAFASFLLSCGLLKYHPSKMISSFTTRGKSSSRYDVVLVSFS
jgi:hypothetical protein